MVAEVCIGHVGKHKTRCKVKGKTPALGLASTRKWLEITLAALPRPFALAGRLRHSSAHWE
jgi:hypothetical protein